jgi:hypothetical protein
MVPWRPASAESAFSRCGVIRSGTTPVARYSISCRDPSSAADEGRTMRSTAASGLK